ncbi:MAG: F0F1 ATP synthase subunit delta, partial [Candidatus Omnitrophica bacterium]|nr:F0F1 ATP synthase subunit delta [Candidatus Omnitrophota bacterium]
MKEMILSKRYGEAFLGYAKARLGVGGAAEELRRLKLFIYSQGEFMPFLENKQVAFESKCSLIDKVLQGAFSEETRHFLKVLIGR